MAATSLSEGALKLLGEPVIAVLATVDSKGRPQQTPVWIDVDEGNLLVNTLKGRQKTANMRHSTNVGICIVDPKDPFRVLSVQGTVVEITESDADDHIDRLTVKYMGIDKHPFRHEGDVRVKVYIRPDRVLVQPA